MALTPNYITGSINNVYVGGLYYISNSLGGACSVFMPAASTVAGEQFIFRSLTSFNHNLTGSNQFCTHESVTGNSNAFNGKRITFSNNATNKSVIMISDGFSYCVIGGFGSVVYSAN